MSSPLRDLLLLSGAEPLPSAAGASRDRTLGHCLLEMAQKAGRGHVLLLLDRVWQLLNHQQLCCVWSWSGFCKQERSFVDHLRLLGC